MSGASSRVVRTVHSLGAGALFGAGLLISGMYDPAKVRAFLDITGNWDPSLAFVMAGAIGVTAPAFLLARARRNQGRAAWAGEPLPGNPPRRIDARLVLGSLLFGVGWGCPASVPARHCCRSALAPPQRSASSQAMIVGATVHGLLTDQHPAPGLIEGTTRHLDIWLEPRCYQRRPCDVHLPTSYTRHSTLHLSRRLPMTDLFLPLQLGPLRLRNRIFMAPLTRGRATRDAVPTPLMVEYYRQRAGAGLIITEATGISRQGLGWPWAPGLWNQAQVEGWKPVTAAVHGRWWPHLRTALAHGPRGASICRR